MPYQDSSLQAIIILPKDRTVDGFKNALTTENISAKTNNVKVNLQLPKFRIEDTYKLKPAME